VILEDEEEFSSKNPGFYAFLLQKTYSWPETGTRRLNRPPWRVKI